MKIHKDCPFTEEEILTFKAMLYQVNTSHRCINPAPFCWGKKNSNTKRKKKHPSLEEFEFGV